MNSTRVMALTVIVFSCWAAYGCASSKEDSEPAEPHAKILRYSCDQWGVAKVIIQTDGAGIAVIGWDNEKACGTPS